MTSVNDRNRKFLVFILQETLYALDLAEVAEVAEPPQLWPIPLAPAYYAGVMSFHGEIVAALWLSRFLGRSESRQPGKIIILQQKAASLAFLVDSIVRIVSEVEVSFSAPPDTAFSAGSLTFIEGTATLLDLQTLISTTESDMQDVNCGSKISAVK